jgi:lambda repressor-like predicted transcriptional regulator
MAEIDPNRDERDAEVARLRSLGYSLRVIAAAVGTSLAGVQRALRRTTEPPPAEQFIASLLDDIDDDMPQGPCSRWTVQQQADAYRAKLRVCDDPQMAELIRYRLALVTP